MRNEPSTTDNQLDSRDIVEYIEAQRDYLTVLEADDEPDTDDIADVQRDIDMWQDFIDEAEQYSGDSATDGIFFIHESYFVEYAQELAQDIGAIDRDLDWPACHIDWEAAADALLMDYTSVEIAGETFHFR